MGLDFESLAAKIIEPAIAVPRTLGPGFLESFDHGAFRVALSRSGMPYENKKEVCIDFDGVEVGLHQLDLLVDGQIVVELKAVKALEDVQFAQVKSYLYLSATALFGLIVYGVYDLTNLAVLEKWTLRMTLADIVWGCTLCGTTAILMRLVDGWLSNRAAAT